MSICRSSKPDRLLGYEGRGKKQEALDLFEEAFDLSPENAVVLSTYGQRLLAKGQKERANEMLESALETFVAEMDSGILRSNDLTRLRQTARLLKRDDVLERLEEWEVQSGSSKTLFSERLLAISTSEEEAVNPD